MIVRDFTAKELIGQHIRIECPALKDGKPPMGYAVAVLTDGGMINNVLKLTLTIEPNAVVEAVLTLYLGETVENEVRTEEVTLRDNIEVSFSAIVSEVQHGG